jgi:N-acetyl-D-muramate 6-phosphate phosphatase
LKLRPAALLFDLDGTLIDSAPDLAGTVNDMLLARGLAAVPYAALRPAAGSGARGMLGVAFKLRPGDDAYLALRDEFHDRYGQRMLRLATVFNGVERLLDLLDAKAMPWGIVTNKARRFAQPMVQALGLMHDASGHAGQVLVCGDCTPYTKPHPAPLLEAARRLGVLASTCVYVGDDLRDVKAGHAAGMHSLAAAWGYLGHAEPVADWAADGILQAPEDLLQFVDLA